MLHLFSCFRFGLPFVLYIERTVNWDTLQKEILEKMRHLLRPGVYIQVGNETKWFLCGLFFFFFKWMHCGALWNNLHAQVGPFSLRVVGVVGITYLLPQDERPLCHPTVDRWVVLFGLSYFTSRKTLIHQSHPARSIPFIVSQHDLVTCPSVSFKMPV